MKNIKKIIKIMIIFILLISCSSADKYLGINEDLIEEEEEEKSDGGGGGASNFYSSIAEAQADNLFGYWKFNETSGAITDDEIDINNLSATGTTIISGKFGNCRSFSGATTSYTSCTFPVNTTDVIYTIGFWTNLSSCTGATRYFIDGTEIDFYMNTNGQLYINDGGAKSLAYDIDTGGFGVNTWVYIALVVSGTAGTADLYVNGSHAGTQIINYANNRNITALVRVGYALWGYMDDLAIWKRALLASEILKIYNSNAPLIP